MSSPSDVHSTKRSSNYRTFLPAFFFLAGFIYDLLTLNRVDQWMDLALQGVFLLLLFLMLFGVLLFEGGKHNVSMFLVRWRLAPLWRFRTEIIHFMFGSLLSAYTIFYFKSSSTLVSLVFILALATLLVLNELPALQHRSTQFKLGLLTLCLQSYLLYLIPTLLGFMGVTIFLLTFLLTVTGTWLFDFLLRRQGLTLNERLHKVLGPAALTQSVFFALYFLEILPPVPLSLKYAGIYHNIEKSPTGEYLAFHEAPWWRFWHRGDQDFYAAPGDKIFCFVQIFSPARFEDQIVFHWQKRDSRSGEWISHDRIPIRILGGKNEGFRGYASKTNYEAGRWRVIVETSNEWEIGRIRFRVYNSSESQRDWATHSFR